MTKPRPTPSFSGILTPDAAQRIGAPEVANKRVRFSKTDDGKFAQDVYFNDELICESYVSLTPDGIIED
ncbi:hypothetical protein HN358_04040 [Candidatus Uhrbacteria bacterium]|nr:hypothetical protein [Candidatus Uhrbacteria bacterium]MBT7716949.1 hypothetical protein [Candidatus Uhrbacteria bacterium]